VGGNEALMEGQAVGGGNGGEDYRLCGEDRSGA
ncbi:ATP-dependent RNA helicase DRS1, partial [Trichinella spiralis]